MKTRIHRNHGKARERLRVLEGRGIVKRARDKNGDEVKVLIGNRLHTLWSIHEVANPQHEAELTEAVICFRHAEKVVRGFAVDPQYQADAEIWLSGKKFYLELDRGTEGKKVLSERLAKYAGCADDVLWVCPTQARADVVLSLAEDAEFWVTTLSELLANVTGYIWRDKAGHVSAF